MKEIYLDNSATTAVSPAAAEKAMEMMLNQYGNPSSVHSKGLQAQHEVDHARKVIADALKVSTDEIYFTSGGTEGNNTAVLGAAHALKRRGNRIVTTAVEHSSVLDAAAQLEKEGFEVIYLSPDSSGRVSAEDIRQAVTKDTILVSIMTVNNETGAVQPVDTVSKAIRAAGAPALFHTDAVQAFTKLPLSLRKWGVDLMTVSGHKLHAPKGVGALFVRKGVRILPLHFGGLQEKKLRPGTEASPLIGAMGVAVQESLERTGEAAAVKALRDQCRERLSRMEDIVINSSEESLPYILNFSVPGIRSENIIHYLAARNIFVSGGSACAKGHRSHVLTACGLSNERVDSAVRVSFSYENTPEDIDIFIENLETAAATLARSR